MLNNRGFFLLMLILAAFGFSTATANTAIRFIENKGQWHKDVFFKASIPGGDMYILKNKLKYVFYRQQKHGHDDANPKAALRSTSHQNENLIHAIEIAFVGSNESSSIQLGSADAATINYFKGHDSWASGVRSGTSVIVNNIYKGIDLIVYATGDGIKYDLKVSPGADPSAIKMNYSGQDEITINEGKLAIGTVHGYFFEKKPVSYSGGQKDDVPTNFELQGNTVSFQFPEGYDKNAALTIDPELIFSTYSGSFADNWGFTATFDDEGNLYSGGIVLTVGYPTTVGVFQPSHVGEWDVGILKYDPTGKNLIWATYLGGSNSETPQSIIVNHRGELVIYGTTSSPDFPMTAASFQQVFMGGDPIYDSTASVPYRLVGGLPMRNGTDIFLAVLGDNGQTLTGSTYIGGTANDGIMEKYRPLTKNYGDQFRGEVIVDAQDNIYVASNTSSSDFFIKNGVQTTYGGGFNDGVVMKFNRDLSDLEWSTFAGGSGMDAFFSIKVDRTGNVFAAGGSNSIDFQVTAGSIKTTKPSQFDIDGVVVKFSNDGTQYLKGTYVGTTSYDQVYFLELDSTNHVYLLGQTSGAYAVTPGVYSNANSGQFIHKLSNGLDSTFFSTVIGSGSGSPNFSPTAFLVNECENIFISGWGGALNSPGLGYNGGNTFNLPVTENAFQSQTDGTDFYLMVLLQDAKQLLYGTFFGEIGGNEHVDGGTSRFDKKGIVYQSVCGGCGGSSGFPTYPPDVWSNTNNSNNCNNAAFKFDLASLLARFETNTPEFTNRGIRQGCYPLSLVFLNESLGGENYLWEFGEGTITDQEDSISITYENPGVYPVILTATDINTCTRVSQAKGIITVFDYEFDIMPSDSICFGEQIVLNASGGIKYTWNPENSLQNPSSATPVASPDSTTTYVVLIEDANGCEGEDSLQIKVVPRITPDFTYVKKYDCHDSPTLVFTNTSENASKFSWDFGDGTSSDEIDPEHQYAQTDSIRTFIVTLKAGESFCVNSKSTPVTSVSPFFPNIISPNEDGKNDVFELNIGDGVELSVYNRWGGEVFHADDYKNNWGGDELASGVYFYEIIFADKNTRCNGWVQVMR